MVLAIILLVAGLVLPQFSRSVDQFQLQKSARELTSVLREARNEATTKAHEVTFRIDSENRNFSTTSQEQPYSWPKYIDVKFSSVTSAMVDEPINYIVFHPDGSATGAQLAVSTASTSYYISVDWITGQINVL